MIAPGNEWLAERATRGDASAFGALDERFRASLTAYAWARLRNRADADDVAQEALLDAFLGLARFDVARPFEPWLWAIFKNRLRKFLRRAIRGQDVFVELDETCRQWLEAVPDGEPETPGERNRVARWETLEACLAGLPEVTRTLLWRHHAEEVSLAELAGIMGRPRGSLAQTLVRAREAVRRKMTLAPAYALRSHSSGPGTGNQSSSRWNRLISPTIRTRARG